MKDYFLDKKEQSKKALTVYLDDVRIGFVELKIDSNQAEISYIFDSDYTSNGYCTVVVEKLIEISFNKIGISKIFAYSKSDNISSRKVLEKNNFKENGTKEDFIYYELRKEVEV